MNLGLGLCSLPQTSKIKFSHFYDSNFPSAKADSIKGIYLEFSESFRKTLF